MTEWTAQVNDLVGGWIVTTYPHPLSEHFRDARRVGTVIAECPVEADAGLIADLLNAHGHRFETGGAEWLRTELETWREIARNYLDEREWRTAEWFEAATERDRAEASRRDWAAEAMRLDAELERERKITAAYARQQRWMLSDGQGRACYGVDGELGECTSPNAHMHGCPDSAVDGEGQ